MSGGGEGEERGGRGEKKGGWEGGDMREEERRGEKGEKRGKGRGWKIGWLHVASNCTCFQILMTQTCL